MCGMAFAHLRVVGMAFPWVDFTWAGSQAADLAEWAMGVNGTGSTKLHETSQVRGRREHAFLQEAGWAQGFV